MLYAPEGFRTIQRLDFYDNIRMLYPTRYRSFSLAAENSSPRSPITWRIFETSSRKSAYSVDKMYSASIR